MAALFRVTERGAPVTTNAFLVMMRRTGVKAGVTFNVNPHMLRHGCGYELANEGRPTRSIQDYLGHVDIQHTGDATEEPAWREETTDPIIFFSRWLDGFMKRIEKKAAEPTPHWDLDSDDDERGLHQRRAEELADRISEISEIAERCRIAHGHTRCETCLSIDIRRWHRRGLLTPAGRFFSSQWASNGEPLGSIGALVRRDGVTLSYRLEDG